MNFDYNFKVLLIEVGENNFNNFWVFRLGIFLWNMKLDFKMVIFYEFNFLLLFFGRGVIVLVVNIFGGGSFINFMVR